MLINDHESFAITVDDFCDKEYALKNNLKIHQKYISISDSCKQLIFTFNLDYPIRFSINILMPQDIANACVTLNNKNLIGPFCDYIPDGEKFPCLPSCEDNSNLNHIISTIKPGKIQTINFKWYSTDELILYLYYKNN